MRCGYRYSVSSMALSAGPGGFGTNGEGTAIVLGTGAEDITHGAAPSGRTDADRKRQRDYQAKHVKNKKDAADEAARELADLRAERVAMELILFNALPQTDGPSSSEPLNLLTVAQRIASEAIRTRRAGPSIMCANAPALPTQESAPVGRDPVLGDRPMIVPIDLTELLKTIQDKLPLQVLLDKAPTAARLDKTHRGVIDITTGTANEVGLLQITTELKQLLGISDDDSKRCTSAANVLRINSIGAIGAYMSSNLTKVHGHCMGVLNLLLGGTKRWRLWKPGRHPDATSVEDVQLDQQPGELLWLPPGWYHEVFTSGIAFMNTSRHRDVNADGGVAYSLACWHVPTALRAQTVLAYALGKSVESQGGAGPLDVKGRSQKLYEVFVDGVVDRSQLSSDAMV